MKHWIVKQEPTDYGWAAFQAEGTTAWTGVRNFQARNHLRAMRKGDLVAYYHSGEERQLVGLACVAREAYPDPTATDGDWVCVDLHALRPLTRPVPLACLKADSVLRELPLVRQSRLSVSPATPEQFERLLALAHTAPPRPRVAGPRNPRTPRP